MQTMKMDWCLTGLGVLITVFLSACQFASDAFDTDDGTVDCRNDGLGCNAPFECRTAEGGSFDCRRGTAESTSRPGRNLDASPESSGAPVPPSFDGGPDGTNEGRNPGDGDPGEGDEPGGEPIDAQSNDPVPADDAPPPDSNESPQNPSSCTPNTVLGTCEVCDASGRRIKPDLEPNCPPIDCGSNANYERADENGRTVCYESVRESGSNTVCAEIGRCATEQEYCGTIERREVLALDVTPCAFMEGCLGQTPPRIEDYGEGTTCNRTGQCQGRGESARCSVFVPAECRLDEASDALRFCGEGTEENRRYCDYYVQPAFGGTSCFEFCEGLQLDSCDQGNGERRCCWNNVSEGSCDTRPEFFACDGSGCETNSCTNQLCRCFVR